MPIEKKKRQEGRKEKKQNDDLDAVAMISEKCHYLRWKMKRKKIFFRFVFLFDRRCWKFLWICCR